MYYLSFQDNFTETIENIDPAMVPGRLIRQDAMLGCDDAIFSSDSNDVQHIDIDDLIDGE